MTGLMFVDDDGKRWSVQTIKSGTHVMIEAAEGDESDDNGGDAMSSNLYIPITNLDRLADAIAWIRKHADVPKPTIPPLPEHIYTG